MKKQTYDKAKPIVDEIEKLNAMKEDLKSDVTDQIAVSKKDLPDLFKQLNETALKLVDARIVKLNKELEAL